MSESMYEKLGVSATKGDVHDAVDSSDSNQDIIYPGAFCKVTRDILGGSARHANASHSDGDGSKIIVSYLHFKETDDATIFRGDAQGCVAMNVDDLACIGAVDRYLITNTVDRNKRNAGDPRILKELLRGYAGSRKMLQEHKIALCGGETADLPNQVQTLVVNANVTTRMLCKDIIDCSRIVPGDVIIGLASDGQATYEDRPNSGIGNNGLTLAQHRLLSAYYREKYPESVDQGADQKNLYQGPHRLDSRLKSGMTVGEALTSPTRICAPIIKDVLGKMKKQVHGIFHNTGGGLTKSMGFGEGVAYIKDLTNAPPPPEVFLEIGRQGADDREMAQVFNLGYLMEIVAPEKVADDIIKIVQTYGIAARRIGRCVRSDKKMTIVNTPNFGEHTYYPPKK